MKDVIRILADEMEMALDEGEVPVACVITKDNRVLASAHNKKIALNDPFAHAEVLCIKKASFLVENWNLKDCELYVSLKPCKMCQEVIKESRIKKVFYVLNSEKIVSDNVQYTQIKNLEEYSVFRNKIINFFKDKR